MTNPTHYLFAVRDAVADVFNTPFPSLNVQVALRGFSVEVNRSDEQNAYFTHSQDFSLYEVATYDSKSGVITAYDIPKLVASAHSLKQLPQNQA